jgi:hypothetical protein
MMSAPSATSQKAERFSPACQEAIARRSSRIARDEKTIDAKMFFHDKRHYL